MRRHITTATLVLAPLMWAGALAAQDTAQTQNPDPYKQPAVSTQQQPQQLSDTALLAKLHTSNQREVRLGQLAQRNGQSAAVKRFGSDLVRDHQAADRRVTDLARQLGVALPMGQGHDKMKDHDRQPMDTANRQGREREDSMRQRDQAQRPDSAGWQGREQGRKKHDMAHEERQLGSLRGAAFDSAFARVMFQTHDRNITMLEQAQHQVQNAQLRSLIASVLPTMRQHRQTAQSLMNSATTTSSTQ